MLKKYKSQFIIALIIVAILFILSIYIVFKFKDKNKEEVTLAVNCSPSNSVIVYNNLPISDVLGKNIEESNKNAGYVTINIQNENEETVQYQVYITKTDQSGSHIKDNYVKYYLTDENNNPLKGFDNNLIPTYNDFLYLNDKPSSKLLYEDKIEANTSKKLFLRVWISDSYPIVEKENDYAFKIGVRGFK